MASETDVNDERDAPGAARSRDPLAELLTVLDLEDLGEAHIRVDGVEGDDETDLGESAARVFVGQSQRQPHGRVFGGQVLAQSVVAAGRTVEGVGHDGPRPIHSLHGYFVRPGDDTHTIRFAVERIRDGRSFSTRRVHAIQYGVPILSMIASFQEPAEGLDHQEEVPAAPDPQTLPTQADELAALGDPVAVQMARVRPIDLRHVDGALGGLGGTGGTGSRDPDPQTPAADHQSVWLRTRGALPDDPLVHAAVLAYASDYSLLEPVLRRHGLTWRDPRLRVASLDHAMWFHRRARADEWTLYTQQTPSAQGGRGLAFGRMFGQDGRLVASVAQEGMVRLKES